MGAVRIYIGLGSNLGDRLSMLQRAVACLSGDPRLQFEAYSGVYESPAWGYESDNAFLNAVVQALWQGGPQELSQLCQHCERQLGRQPSGGSNAYSDRPIDIDIIAAEAVEFNSPELVIPHPQAHRRGFVLLPLSELAPYVPLNGRPAAEWISELPPGEIDLIMRLDDESIDPLLAGFEPKGT